MKISVIIPYLNDHEVLRRTLPKLVEEIPDGEGEVLIIDNGSHERLKRPDMHAVRVIRNQVNIGVGGAFNQGAELALCENLVFTAADVIPQEGWFDRVNRTLEKVHDSIFCATTSDFDPFKRNKRPFRQNALRRYGADILYKMDRSHLSDGHKDKNDPKFHKILQAQWNYRKCSHPIATVECILGAFYWMRRNDFRKLRGWNGHIGWGSLEPMISIKARAHGMHLFVDQELEAAHYFGRDILRGSRADWQYYNMLFMAHTMFSEALRDELIEYLECGDSGERLGRLNVSQAKKLIKRRMGLVQGERDYNSKAFRHGLIANWDKFNNEML